MVILYAGAIALLALIAYFLITDDDSPEGED